MATPGSGRTGIGPPLFGRHTPPTVVSGWTGFGTSLGPQATRPPRHAILAALPKRCGAEELGRMAHGAWRRHLGGLAGRLAHAPGLGGGGPDRLAGRNPPRGVARPGPSAAGGLSPCSAPHRDGAAAGGGRPVPFTCCSPRAGRWRSSTGCSRPQAMVLAQTLIALPFVAGITLAAVAAVPPELGSQVRSLGAGPWQVRRAVLREARGRGPGRPGRRLSAAPSRRSGPR